MKTKVAKIPTDVWDDRKRIAKKFGFNSATDGFRIANHVLHGDYKLTRMKIKGKKKRYCWKIEFPNW